MRKFDLDISGKSHSVSIEKREGGYTATIGDSSYEIEAKRVEGGFLVLKVNGEWFKVFLGENGGRYCVSVGEESYDVERSSSGDAQAGAVMEEKVEGNVVSAPMPGKVIKIKCGEGETVSTGQTLAIIEAMKMENNINAHRDAVIKKILVREGDQVNLSDPIIEFEEEAD